MFHVSSIDHLLSGEPLFSGAVVCTRLRHRRRTVLPFSAQGCVVKLSKSVNFDGLNVLKDIPGDNY